MLHGAPLRVVCISDTHGFHRRLTLPPGDILIQAGDCLPDNDQPEALADFNQCLGALLYKHRIVIAGNRDLLLAKQPKQARRLLTNAVYLENSGVTVEGLQFWGCPITPVPDYMAFAVERGASRNSGIKCPRRLTCSSRTDLPFAS